VKNLLTDHPSKDVRAAAIRLIDALCMWNRSTGRENILIIKDSVGCEYRTLSGAPPPEYVSDAQLLEAFDGLLKPTPPAEGDL
jgi:hypothetical protein